MVDKSAESRKKLAKIKNVIGDFVCRLCQRKFADVYDLAEHRCPSIIYIEYKCPECAKGDHRLSRSLYLSLDRPFYNFFTVYLEIHINKLLHMIKRISKRVCQKKSNNHKRTNVCAISPLCALFKSMAYQTSLLSRVVYSARLKLLLFESESRQLHFCPKLMTIITIYHISNKIAQRILMFVWCLCLESMLLLHGLVIFAVGEIAGGGYIVAIGHRNFSLYIIFIF